MASQGPIEPITVENFIAEYNRVSEWYARTYPKDNSRFDSFYNSGAKRWEFVFTFFVGKTQKSIANYILDHMWKTSPEYLAETLLSVYPNTVSGVRKAKGDCF